MPQNYFSYQIIKTSFPLLNFRNRKSCNSGQNFWMFWWYNEIRQENGFLGLFLLGNFEKSLIALSVHPLLLFSDDGVGGAWRGGAHVWQGACMACMPPGRYCEIRSMSGQYASYWNAFLSYQNIKTSFPLLNLGSRKSSNLRQISWTMFWWLNQIWQANQFTGFFPSEILRNLC